MQRKLIFILVICIALLLLAATSPTIANAGHQYPPGAGDGPGPFPGECPGDGNSSGWPCDACPVPGEC